MNSTLPPRQRLESYLQALRVRIRTFMYARAAAVGAASVIALTLTWVWLLNRDGFPAGVALGGRIAILAVLAIVATVLVWLPLRNLRRHEGADEIERRLPAQRGRIQTYLDMRRRESAGMRSPLLDLLAGDAANLAENTPVETVIPGPRIWIGVAVAAAAVAALLFLLAAGPAYWGYGTRYLLLGMELPKTAVPDRKIDVTPGNATVRRNSDVAIRADIAGFRPDEALVFVRFEDEQEWQRAPMQAVPESEHAKWEFKLYAVRGPLHYYVQANDARNQERSAEHSLGVVDLPRIERVRLTYDYPDWTDLPQRTEETVRDIQAVAGTGVKLEVFASAALHEPVIELNGKALAMEADGGSASGDIQVAAPGSYRISARVANELVALTDDYAIELVSDQKPTIDIEKPGRDWRATSIEEVPVRISAQDDFRLQDVQLRYAVNGGEWRTLDVTRGGKDVRSESLLKLEELGAPQATQPAAAPNLSPGDLVSYYAVARDRTQSVQTDLFMVQVQPFERRFSQDQGGGGDGNSGGMDEQGAISERQREILLATWNLQRSDSKASRTRSQLEESARMLAEMQATLAAQARTLSERTRARMSLEEDERIKQFVESLEQAAAAMDPAAKHLNGFKLADAIPVEQQALQQLLRAETAFRDVQVSMQQNGSGGGGQQAARNFTEMFELEMDVDKNHYETESPLAKETKREELDDAVRKLKELAERQEKLAQEAQRAALPEREQRWRQEQLRREAEDLRRRLAELQRSQQQQNANTRNQSPGQRQQSQDPAGQMGNAMESMRRALDDMRAASSGQQGSSNSSSSASQSAREASRQLRQALDQMDTPDAPRLAEELQDFATRTQQLSEQQRRTENDLQEAISAAQAAGRPRGQLQPQRAQALSKTKQQMAGELRALQQEMRDAMNDHRSRQPETASRLTEIVGDLENTNVVGRINRSATEIQYGRARDAASREGLISDVLEALEKDLRDTARLAAGEAEKDVAPADPEGLLAQLSDLRRQLQQAQNGEGANSGERSRSSAAGERGEQPSGESPQQSSTNSSASSGLGAWNPASPQGSRNGGRVGNVGDQETERAQFRRDANDVAERVRDLANRLGSGELDQDEIRALQRMAHQLRSLAGDPIAAHARDMARLVDQIELATLSAAEKVRNATPAHTSPSASEESKYREAVAEYYRRLGGG